MIISRSPNAVWKGPLRIALALEGADAISRTSLQDVYFGDVWLCGGQSNMVFLPRNDDEAATELALVNPMARFWLVPRGETNQAQKWYQEVDAQQAGLGSAVGHYFAQKLRAAPALAGVPVALVLCNYGATSIEQWLPAEAAAPPNFYESMVKTIIPANFKGVLWYQGEGNSAEPYDYATKLVRLANQWRADFRFEDMPFFIVQLPSFGNGRGNWAEMRYQQQIAADLIPYAWRVVMVDEGELDEIHPRWKRPVGERLASMALRHVYDVATAPAISPTVSTVDWSTLELTFAMDPGAVLAGPTVHGFEVCMNSLDEWHPATAEVVGGDCIRVHALAAEVVAMRYAWADYPEPRPDLFDNQGLPAAPFWVNRDEIALYRPDQPVGTVHVSTSPGNLYTIQASPDLVMWEDFLVNQPGTGAGLHLPVGFSTYTPTSFWRATITPQ